MAGSKKYRRIRWNFLLHWALGSVAGVVCVFWMAWGYENWRGRREWAALKKEYAVQRVALEFEDWERMRGEVRLDESNFFGTPLLKEFLEATPERRTRELDTLRTGEPSITLRAAAVHLPRLMANDDWRRTQGASLDLPYWKAVLAQENLFTVIGYDNRIAAKEILYYLGKWAPEFDELDRASRRPNHQATFKALARPESKENSVEELFPRISKVLVVRAAAELEVGEVDAALRDFELNEQLAHALLTGNREACNHAGQRMMAFGVRIVWEGVARHRWTTEHLDRIERILGARNHRQSWIESTKGDLWQIWQQEGRLVENCGLTESLGRSAEVLTIAATQQRDIVRRLMGNTADWPAAAQESSANARQSCDCLAEMAGLFARAQCQGYQYREAAAILRQAGSTLKRCESWAAKGDPLDMLNLNMEAPEHDLRAYRDLRMLFSPRVLGYDAEVIASFENMTRMARVACALERNWIENGRYPESTGETASLLSRGALVDAFSGRPFRYIMLGDSRYRLSSSASQNNPRIRFTQWPVLGDTNVWSALSPGERHLFYCGGLTWLDIRTMRE